MGSFGSGSFGSESIGWVGTTLFDGVLKREREPSPTGEAPG